MVSYCDDKLSYTHQTGSDNTTVVQMVGDLVMENEHETGVVKYLRVENLVKDRVERTR